MHEAYKTKGFIFKKEDRSEADRIFSVFTQDFGRIEVFAKAIRRIASKLKGGIDIFSLSGIEFIEGRNRKTLTDAIFIERFNNISEIPKKAEIMRDVSCILDDFIKGQEIDEKIWNFAIDFFKRLNDQKPLNKNQYLLYYYFFWNFVSILGHSPEFSECAVCGNTLNPYGLYFSNKEGGIICNSCYNKIKEGLKIKPDVIKIIRVILKRDWETLLKLKIEIGVERELQQVSESYYNYLISTYSYI